MKSVQCSGYHQVKIREVKQSVVNKWCRGDQRWGGGRWVNDDKCREVLRRAESGSVTVSVSVIRIRIKLPMWGGKKKINIGIRTKLPVRTKFTRKGKITRNPPHAVSLPTVHTSRLSS